MKTFGERGNGKMTNALVKHKEEDERTGLIKRMIAKDATDDELTLFLHQCSRTGLDPFSKQIYAISRWSKAAGRNVMAIQVSIDGARLIAERSGKYDNQEGPYWCGDDGQWVDVWLSKDAPRAAKVLVYKVGSTRATTGIAHWSEYSDAASNFWKSKPALMLAKCAEMLALRKAFPQELSGLYAQEEMAQADVIDVTPRQVNQDTGEIVDGDELFAPEPARPKASQSRLNLMHMRGMEYYKTQENWNKKRPEWVSEATGDKYESANDLSPEQCEWVIERLEARIAKRAAANAQEPIATVA